MADGAYSSISCSICKVKWQDRVRNGLFSSICGSPFVKCSSCNNILKTPYVLYRNLNIEQKIRFWISKSSAGILALLLFVTICNVEIANDDIGIVYVANLLLLIFFGVRISNAKKQITLFEKWFDENDGFLWSHQQFPG